MVATSITVNEAEKEANKKGKRAKLTVSSRDSLHLGRDKQLFYTLEREESKMNCF